MEATKATDVLDMLIIPLRPTGLTSDGALRSSGLDAHCVAASVISNTCLKTCAEGRGPARVRTGYILVTCHRQSVGVARRPFLKSG
jgi:hypothetical protein